MKRNYLNQTFVHLKIKIFVVSEEIIRILVGCIHI